MSEEFDKEAEREKLREQFASEEQEREQTRRMSELLLKGATMTNRHCDRCGDPIFRQNGQEFCPSCQGRGQAAAQQQQQQREQRPAEADEGTEPVADTAPEQDDDGTPTTPAQPAPPNSGHGRRVPSSRSRDAPAHGADTGGRGPESVEPTGEFDDAVAAVEETIRRFSAAAANTDDPERAREYLKTVREATETLAALQSR
ncbi:Sjogren's syndrome/scleroderma autoantigen 1 family protein [Haloarchaeobius litoreus]|uniref:Sjogren's syndrome/scleroderma autoantigen 1 family protein n=1 Tax=Haloarchaeobius litoreus TaxID=755306 RepID=A0ABD6DKH0_9EURY|nr:Sjogren's syndrome/scleroderma autoantigen 1 family protein [Haloarchaeobius litoreus]